MKEPERKKLEHTLYMTGFSLLGFIMILGFLYAMLPIPVWKLFQTPCMFYAVTGIYCPGCGGTRAVISLLKGQVVRSFFYHPIVIYGAVIYIWFMVSHTIEKISHGKWKIGMHYRDIYLWIALGIVVVNVMIKDIALAGFGVDILGWLDGA